MSAMDVAALARGAASSTGELRYGFRVAGLQLVPAARILTEMVAEARIFPVPKAAAALAGVTNLRGTIVPLLDRREVSRGGPHIRPFQHRVLVFDREEQRVGLLLDAAPELLNLVPAPSDTLRPQHATLAAFLVRPWAQAEQPDQVWWEFNHRAAFESLALGAHPVSLNEEVIA
jgi:chemotaxis signal transduction protein